MKEAYVMKARIKFSKSDTMKFIGHLDIMRYFQKPSGVQGLIWPIPRVLAPTS